MVLYLVWILNIISISIIYNIYIYNIYSLDMQGCICHFVKWQIHRFIPKGGFIRAGLTRQVVIAEIASKLFFHTKPDQRDELLKLEFHAQKPIAIVTQVKLKFAWFYGNWDIPELLNCFLRFFIHLKLELLTQFPASNDKNIKIFKNYPLPILNYRLNWTSPTKLFYKSQWLYSSIQIQTVFIRAQQTHRG